MAVNRIVCGIDDSDDSHAALRFAVDEARLRDATLEVVSVYSPASAAAFPALPTQSDTEQERQRAEATRKLIESAVERLGDRAEGVKLEINPMKHSRPAVALMDRTSDADLVVVAHRGRGGFKGLRLGSVSEQLTRWAKCPVVVVRPTTS